jgi:hypothetical protein
MIIKSLGYCFLRLSNWAIVNTDGVDVVTIEIEPLDITYEKAYIIACSTMSHRFSCMNMKYILNFHTL